MPYVDNIVSNLVINVLDKNQFDLLTPDPSQLYMITDDLDPAVLPSVTSADDNKILKVKNGQWDAYISPEVVNKTSSDTTNTLENDTFYIFPAMASLSITVTGTGLYIFRFTSGSTPTTLTITGAVMPDSFTVEANKVYEVNIYEGYGVVSSWTAS